MCNWSWRWVVFIAAVACNPLPNIVCLLNCSSNWRKRLSWCCRLFLSHFEVSSDKELTKKPCTANDKSFSWETLAVSLSVEWFWCLSCNIFSQEKQNLFPSQKVYCCGDLAFSCARVKLFLVLNSRAGQGIGSWMWTDKILSFVWSFLCVSDKAHKKWLLLFWHNRTCKVMCSESIMYIVSFHKEFRRNRNPRKLNFGEELFKIITSRDVPVMWKWVGKQDSGCRCPNEWKHFNWRDLYK